MTPEQLKIFFDANAIIIIFVWGIICKYVPFLAKIPNQIIPWIGSIGYIIAKLVIPSAAQAGVTPEQGGAILGFGGVILGSFTSAVWARQLYEGFGRFLLEGLFKMKKATA